MAVITIANLYGKVVPVGDIARPLLHAIQQQRLDWMHQCGAKGRCTTCKVTILAGAEHLSPLTAPEQRYRDLGLLRSNERLSCQAATSGDVVISVPPESRLPHVKYSF